MQKRRRKDVTEERRRQEKEKVKEEETEEVDGKNEAEEALKLRNGNTSKVICTSGIY